MHMSESSHHHDWNVRLCNDLATSAGCLGYHCSTSSTNWNPRILTSQGTQRSVMIVGTTMS